MKVYTYIKKPLWLTPNYSEWVGAWWLVYAVGTCISLILCLFLCLFDLGRRRKPLISQREIQSPTNPTYPLIAPSSINPNDSLQNNRFLSSRTSSSTTNLSSSANIPGNEMTMKEKEALPMEIVGENCTTLSTFIRLKEFFYDISFLIKHLLLNLRFMGITGCAIVEALLIKGYLAFLSKHIEYQFRTTASHSSVYIGVISLFSVRISFMGNREEKNFVFLFRLFSAHH